MIETTPADLYHVLHKPHSMRVDKQAQARATEQLNATNPVLALPAANFLALLRLVVASYRLVHGSPRTKTSIQLRQGLEALEGSVPVSGLDLSDEALWNWETLAALNVEPLVGFVYMRLMRDLKAMHARTEPA